MQTLQQRLRNDPIGPIDVQELGLTTAQLDRALRQAADIRDISIPQGVKIYSAYQYNTRKPGTRLGVSRQVELTERQLQADEKKGIPLVSLKEVKQALRDPLIKRLTFIPIGVELTYICNLHEEAHYDIEYILMSARQYLRDHPVDGINPEWMHRDDGCIELPTEVIRSWPVFARAYLTVTKLMEKYKCYPYSKWHCSGGGHIHINQQRKAVVNKLFDHFYWRPYIGWAFNDPEADEDSTLYGCFNYPVYNLKRYGIEISPQDRYNTIEFRFFQAPYNWNEQVEHVVFVQQYLQHIRNTKRQDIKRPPIKEMSLFLVREMEYSIDSHEEERYLRKQSWSYVSASVLFLDLIEALGLPKARYVKYTQRNIKQRAEWNLWS